MRTFTDLAKILKRSTVYSSGLNLPFEMPTVYDARSVVAYRTSIQIVANLHTKMIPR
jgi:hypothetical protein